MLEAELALNALSVPVIIVFVWWRLDRIEKRLERIEEELERLERSDRELGERVARLEGWRNGLRGIR